MSSRQVQGPASKIVRHAVVIEDLERVANVSYPLQEVLQLLHRHFLNLVILPVVEPISCKHGELGAIGVRCIVVKISATVGRPEVGGDAQAVDVPAADCVTRGGDPGDHVGGASAVVVEPPADGVLVSFPGTDVELSDLRNHVCQSVGGCFVVGVGLVLVRIQLSTLVDHGVGVVIKDSL